MNTITGAEFIKATSRSFKVFPSAAPGVATGAGAEAFAFDAAATCSRVLFTTSGAFAPSTLSIIRPFYAHQC